MSEHPEFNIDIAQLRREGRAGAAALICGGDEFDGIDVALTLRDVDTLIGEADAQLYGLSYWESPDGDVIPYDHAAMAINPDKGVLARPRRGK